MNKPQQKEVTYAEMLKVNVPRRYFDLTRESLPKEILENLSTYFLGYENNQKLALGITLIIPDDELRLKVSAIVCKWLISLGAHDLKYVDYPMFTYCAKNNSETGMYFDGNVFDYHQERQFLFVDNIRMPCTPSFHALSALRYRENMITFFGVKNITEKKFDIWRKQNFYRPMVSGNYILPYFAV